MKVALLTPTYKRRHLLEKLFDSLLQQTNSNFVWVVINDGSPDDTDEFMSLLQRDSNIPFEIRYTKIVNSGKGQAVNIGLDNCTDADFVIIIDDDEILYPNAVEIISSYVERFNNSNCGGIEFLRDDLEGNPIGNYSKPDFFMSIQMRKRKNLYIDGYTGYFVDKISNMRAPKFDGERYIGPGILQCMVGNKYELLWPNIAIGTTEYLDGGLTKQGRPLRLKNPKGMIYYSVLMQEKDAGLLLRFIYAAIGYAYMKFAHLTKAQLKKEGIDCSRFFRMAYIPGLVLATYWKIRYSKYC